MRIDVFATGLLVGLCLFGFSGCGKKPSYTERVHEHSHVHSEEGPHGGHIIEIGAKAHHAELVHDDATHKVGIHVLDGDAKASKPIEAKMVLINVAEDGVASQYELSPAPQSGEAAGKSSYYEIVSEPLCKIICGESEAKNVKARVSIQIGERPYVGLIETAAHEHDHDHGHAQKDGTEHAEEHGHVHAAGDVLKWEKELDDQGYQIALGYHGEKLVAGQEIEPAVKITRDGQPVADAKVFNALLADDSQKVLAEEAATVYEPPTDEEPAHYAQGALKVPSGVQKVILRYRIVLPSGEERTIDVPVAVQ